MNEITKDELLEGLLGYGMFAEKIPPIFTSKPLYDYCIANGYDWLSQREIRISGLKNMTVQYLLTKAKAANKSPVQIIDDLVSEKILAATM